ncbi:MAG: class I SAM-dependent methyltransferase [Sulfurifustaceae bacterium]
MMRSLKGAAAPVNDPSPRPLRSQVVSWFETPLGQSLQAVEAHRLRSVLPSLYGTVALQLGRIGRLDLLDACIAPTRIVVDEDGTGYRSRTAAEQQLTGARTVQLRAQAHALPLDERSVDVAVLPHTLDFSEDPHTVLREVSRVLRPEGHVVIIGFNPMSLWGVRRLIARRPRTAPWSGHFFRLARVKDWLALLDFECTQGAMLYYRPPFTGEHVMERLFFIEKAGDRWWPLAAAVYLLVAKKRVFGMTPLPIEWKRARPTLAGVKPAVLGPMPGGCAQNAARIRNP